MYSNPLAASRAICTLAPHVNESLPATNYIQTLEIKMISSF